MRIAGRDQGTTFEELSRLTGFPIEERGDRAADPTPGERRELERLDPGGLRHGMIG